MSKCSSGSMPFLFSICTFSLYHVLVQERLTPHHPLISSPPSLTQPLFLHLHLFHPVSGTQPYVSAVPAPLPSYSSSSSQPPGPGPPACATPSSPPPARRWLCRLISSEIGELQARAHMHRHFSCSKRHFRHWKDPGIQNTKRGREIGGEERERQERCEKSERVCLYKWTGLDSFSLSHYPKLLSYHMHFI